jgi:hypothetical protein
VVIVTSEPAPGVSAGLQLPASAQSELLAPVHVDLLMMGVLTLITAPFPQGIAARPPAQANFTSVPVPLSEARVKFDFE